MHTKKWRENDRQIVTNMSLIYESSTNCTLWSMFKNSTLFGTSFRLVKTVPRVRVLAT